jgi:hypothetical protein
MTTPAVLRVLADNQGITIPEGRLIQAAEGYATLSAKIAELRSIPLSFLTDVIEPATANQWIENGGHS